MAEGHIHKHLHSMFHLLRNEETLKMVCMLIDCIGESIINTVSICLNNLISYNF